MPAVAVRPISSARFPRWGYLDKFYTNELMPRALLVGVLLFAIIMGGWMGWGAIQRARKGKQVESHSRIRKVKILTAADIGVPPSLTQQQVSAVQVQVKARPAVAMPVPVPDEQAVEATIATQEEMAEAGGTSTALGAGMGAGDSLVIDTGNTGLPSPDDYVAYEKEPEIVSMKDPVYPDLAREAGVEGTVLIRVLVGEDGFVKDMIVIQSVPMLDEAAAGAAETAVFKPALQKDRPVAVWMVIPIEFKLHS
jgi:protein TonB